MISPFGPRRVFLRAVSGTVVSTSFRLHDLHLPGLFLRDELVHAARVDRLAGHGLHEGAALGGRVSAAWARLLLAGGLGPGLAHFVALVDVDHRRLGGVGLGRVGFGGVPPRRPPAWRSRSRKDRIPQRTQILPLCEPSDSLLVLGQSTLWNYSVWRWGNTSLQTTNEKPGF